jgi:DNA-binding response OmpR family regulator
VFEKRPRWAPELQRQFADESVRIVACRSLRDVADRSANVARGVIVLDLTADTAECLRFLGNRLGDVETLPIFVVGSAQTAALEWTVRELGATAFFPGTIPGHEMAALCRRQWSRKQAAAAPESVRTIQKHSVRTTQKQSARITQNRST